MPNKKIWLPVLCLVVLLAASGIAYRVLSTGHLPEQQLEAATPQAAPENGGAEESAASGATEQLTPAPDFTLYDADGQPLSLSGFFGKPVVLNFWASWCPPCVGEMPDFDAVYRDWGDQVEFVMVDVVDGSRETVDKGLAFVAEGGYSFPVYFDTDQEGAYAYQLTTIPRTYLIDAHGNITAYSQGAVDGDTLRRAVEAMAAGE